MYNSNMFTFVFGILILFFGYIFYAKYIEKQNILNNIVKNNGGINNEIKVPEVKTIFIKSPEVMTKERAKLLGYAKEETFEF